ncbi:hypothetical protein A5747_13375 [Mycobacterium sp. IS-836]|nr:hypothetical protein A5747_13375 [Mycobacterium sp. IS-836]
MESDASESFKPITSQAEFDAAIKGRISRAEKAAEKKATARIAELEGIVHQFESEKLSEDEKRDRKLQELTAALAERENMIKGFEREKLVASLADEKELPRKFWDRVRGESEEEILADIDVLLEALPKNEKKPPRDGTIKVTPSGDDGGTEMSAADVIRSFDPSFTS